MSLPERLQTDKSRTRPFSTTALSYADAGLAVLPLKPRSKVPAGSLVPHGVKDTTTDPNKIHAWADRLPEANIGIATGSVSGVFVVDVDPRNGGCQSLAALVHQFGGLPETVTVTTGGPDGGHHFYFAYPGFRVRNVDLSEGLQIKGAAGYIVAPRSIHPSGGTYVGKIDRTLIATAPDWLLEHLNTSNPYTSTRTHCMCKAREAGATELTDAAIDISLPTRTGERNHRVFDLVRRLKGISGMACLDVDDARPIFDRWFRRALPFIGTKDIAESWRDFRIAWTSVAFPFGSTLRDALHVTICPQPAERYDPVTRQLATLCCGLAMRADDRTFYLACRTAGALLGVSHVTAAARLRQLVLDGVIELVERHTRTRAAVYRWISA